MFNQHPLEDCIFLTFVPVICYWNFVIFCDGRSEK